VSPSCESGRCLFYNICLLERCLRLLVRNPRPAFHKLSAQFAIQGAKIFFVLLLLIAFTVWRLQSFQRLAADSFPRLAISKAFNVSFLTHARSARCHRGRRLLLSLRPDSLRPLRPVHSDPVRASEWGNVGQRSRRGLCTGTPTREGVGGKWGESRAARQLGQNLLEACLWTCLRRHECHIMSPVPPRSGHCNRLTSPQSLQCALLALVMLLVTIIEVALVTIVGLILVTIKVCAHGSLDARIRFRSGMRTARSGRTRWSSSSASALSPNLCCCRSLAPSIHSHMVMQVVA
jgi:hypothetical protein